MGVKICPLHKEEMIYGYRVQYSHWYGMYLNPRDYFEASKHSFPCANIIKWGSCCRPSNITHRKKYCVSCRKNFKDWWEENGDAEKFPKLSELLEEF